MASNTKRLLTLELTDSEKITLKRRYEILLKEYKTKIVQLVGSPIKIANELNYQRVFSGYSLTSIKEYITSFPLRKHQNEALFYYILGLTSYTDVNRIVRAMQVSGNRRLENIFVIIGTRLQASVDKEIRWESVRGTVFDDSSTKQTGIDVALVEQTGSEALTALHRAAIEGDYKGVKDILKDAKYMRRETWLTESTNQSPIHYAALGENSKDSLKFVKTLIEVAISKELIMRPSTEVEDEVDGPTNVRWTVEELINHADASGNTALHLATEKESVQFVQYLCNLGGNIVKGNMGITPLELMYDKTPEAVVNLLNGALTSDINNSSDGNLVVKMDFRAIIGTAADDPGDDDETNATLIPYSEMDLLANMIFRNYKESSKIILPHIVVKTFLDLKWKKFRASVFFYTAFYVLMHLWFTCFVIQVFIVRYPYQRTNETLTDSDPEDTKLTFFGYIRGNWKSANARVLIDDSNPLSALLYEQGIALMAVGVFLFIIEIIECYLILKVTTYTRKSQMQYRHITLAFILVAVAVYNENMEAILVGLFIFLLHIYDEISDRIGRVRLWKITCVTASIEPVLLFIVTIALYLMIILRSFLYYDVLATGILSTFNFTVFLVAFFVGNYNLDSQKKHKSCISSLFSFFVSFLHNVKYFSNRMSAYLANVENILQLVFIALMIFVTTVVRQREINSWYYLAAAFSVVLAWILILMQIGNIYGLGVYIQIFNTVLRRFLGVMSTYSVLLVAFSIAFSIIFPDEKLFQTLPASFFRVVSMMVGELNFDDIFNKEDSGNVLPAFPYATHWIHTGFIVSVTIVLINLLIGLTVSDIEKIVEISDVIHRSIQIERLYILERLYVDVPLFRLLNRGNIFVIPQADRITGQGLEFTVRIKDLHKALHKDIRLLAENPEEYAATYLQK